MKPHRYLDEAEQELRDQIGYFDGISRAVAIRFVDEIERAVDEIREHPRIGAPLGRLLRRRVLTGFKYSVLYVDTEAEIVIVAIAPHRRRPRYWRDRLKGVNRLGRPPR